MERAKEEPPPTPGRDEEEDMEEEEEEGDDDEELEMNELRENDSGEEKNGDLERYLFICLVCY